MNNLKYIQDINKKSKILFSETGYPNTNMESWRFTNTNKIKNLVQNYISQEPNYDSIKFKKSKNCITIINGKYNSQRSYIDNSFLITSISDGIKKYSSIIKKNFNKLNLNSNPFVSQNTASFKEGIFIYVKEKHIKKYLNLRINHYLFKNGKLSSINFPRILLHIEDNINIKILETFNYDNNDVPIFQNYVNEIYLNENSSLKYSIIQNQTNTSQISHWDVNQFKSSNFKVNYFGSSSDLIRNNFNINLHEDSSSCELYTLCTGDNYDYIDIHLNINHMNKNTSSKVISKSILKQSSKGVFNLNDNISSNAKNSNAYQQNNNLLLSDDCRVHSNPQLEINTDDVQCKHGSTTGELDENILFYLQSRGISRNQAKDIIIRSFANEIIEKYNDSSFIKLVENIIIKWI